MSVTLGKTDLRDYELHLSDGDAVVRNPMIYALINAKLPGVSPENRRVLATPVFSGSTAMDERIQWQTDQFTSEEPRPLSSLTGDERLRYEDILRRAVDEYTRDFAVASAATRKVLGQALTYHSPDKVYCADGRIAITEWGMHPKEYPHYEPMVLGVDLPEDSFADLPNPDPNQNDSDPNPDNHPNTPTDSNPTSVDDLERNNVVTGDHENPPTSDTPWESTTTDEVYDNHREPQSTDIPDNNPHEGSDNFVGNNITDDPSTPSNPDDNPNPNNPYTPSSYDNPSGPNPDSDTTGPNNPGPNNPTDINLHIHGGPGSVPPTTGGSGVPPYGGAGNNGGYVPAGTTGVTGGGVVPPSGGYGRSVVYPAGRRRPWWKWLLWLLLVLLFLFILFACLRSCNSDPMRSVLPVAPEIKEDDISLSEDSVNMEVNNRLILLIAHGGTVPEFVKDFRKKYPDTKKYILSNPDTLIPRVVLTLPKEEKPAFKNNIQSDFPAWDIVIVPDAIYSGSSATVNDPALTDKKKRWYFDMTDVFDAWDITMGDKDLVVAVIDDGFDLSHPELQGKIVSPYNSVTHDGNVFPSKSGHGTHVAATAIGNANNGEGTAGIAPNCKLMPIQVADRNGIMTNSSILDGVLYAIYNGADVVNMSLCMYFNPMLQYTPVPVQKNMRNNNFLEEAKLWNKVFELAEERGVSFVQAGGNQNILMGIDPMQRSPNTIKVSAVQPDKYKANFSNFGDYSVVSAPGVEIYNAIPGNKYDFMQGTSMASPIVAGGVALLKSNDRTLSTPEIATILRETGIPSPSDVGPIVNFARALKGEKTPVDGKGGKGTGPDGDCGSYQRRYNELLMELERLKREHPGCISEPDTLKIPTDATVADLRGTWKSTTTLFNDKDQEVVIYFTFNGTSTGSMKYVEPEGDTYTSPISIRIEDGKIYMDQTNQATSKTGGGYYERYKFVLTPDKDRKASGRGQNLVKASNVINFQLIRLNS